MIIKGKIETTLKCYGLTVVSVEYPYNTDDNDALRMLTDVLKKTHSVISNQTSVFDLLHELQSQGLVVCKIPGKYGGRIRVVVSTNAYWYQKLCENHVRGRRRYPRPRTIIKRRETVKALKRMIAGDYSSEYAERILFVIKELGYDKDWVDS